MIYLLFIVLCIILVWSYYLNGRDVLAPGFLFCASFCFSSAWAMAYSKLWELGLHTNTFFVIAGGVLEFVIVSWLVRHILSTINGRKTKEIKSDFYELRIENWKLILFIFIEIFTCVYSLKWLASNFNGNDWGSIIYAYRYMIVFTEETLAMPRLLSYLRTFVMASGYWYAYIIVNNWYVNKKINVMNIVIVGLSILSSILFGGRQGAINILLAIIALFFLFSKKRKGIIKTVEIKMILKVIFSVAVILAIFQTMGNIVGRNNNAVSFFDYLAKYCGAEIKNLDLFLQEKQNYSNIWGFQTFRSVLNWFGPYFGLDLAPRDLPFRSINGFNLGNVYTTFYDYIYDFGYTGVFILILLMAVLIQLLYEKVLYLKCTKEASFSIVLYGYVFNSIIFSFFSNNFYINQTSKTFAKFLLCWWLANQAFIKIKVNKNGKIYYKKSYYKNNYDMEE